MGARSSGLSRQSRRRKSARSSVNRQCRRKLLPGHSRKRASSSSFQNRSRPTLLITEIRASHDRKSFDCGKRSMNDFLVEKGLSQAYGMTYVVLSDPDSMEIIAYFTISPDPADIISGEYDNARSNRFVSLERLAVDKKHQQQGVGEDLLVYIMRQVVSAAKVLQLDG